MSAKRVRKSYTVAKKLDIIRHIESTGNLDQVARDIGINRRCLQRWRRDKTKLLALGVSHKGAQVRHVKPAQARFPEVERELSKYIKDKRSSR